MTRKGGKTKKKLKQLKKLGAISESTFQLNIEDTDELIEIRKQIELEKKQDSYVCSSIEKAIGLKTILEDLKTNLP